MQNANSKVKTINSTTSYQIPKSPNPQIIKSPNHRIPKSSNFQIIKSSNHPTLPSKLIASSFCASTANSIGSCFNTSLA